MTDAAERTARTVNKALSARGAPYSEYASTLVSWDDVARGTVGSALSCWGANITDTYLKTKEGGSLFTVRPDNWNEKLGVVRATDVALLTGNCDKGSVTAPLRPITLAQFLAAPAQHGAAYTGLSSDTSLSKPELDDKVSIRFQTVFLPLPDPSASVGEPRVQFAAEAYNYHTMSDDDPRNLVLLASSQGIALQADGAGAKRVLHHARPETTGPAQQYWLEAEATRHRVGQQQVETIAERVAARARGKATSETVGIRAMGTRFNALLTAQIPLETRAQPESGFLCWDPSDDDSEESEEEEMDFDLFDASPNDEDWGSMPRRVLAVKGARCASAGSGRGRGRSGRGRSSAARVSRGDAAGTVPPLAVASPKRHADEHVTVTVVIYHCVQGGVPEDADVVAAVEELERFYAACSDSGRLGDAKFEFMTKPLAVEDVLDIHAKVTTQSPPHVV